MNSRTHHNTALVAAFLAGSALAAPALAEELPDTAPSATAPDVAGTPVLALTTSSSNPNSNEFSLIKLTGADAASASDGLRVKVAVLDQYADCRHADLAGRCTAYKVGTGTYSKYGSHGTHTSGTIGGAKHGVATAATILNYGVFADSGWVASGSYLLSAWKDAYARGARISSMSFGCTKMALCFSSAEISTIAAATMPMLYVKAAGNDGALLSTESTSLGSATATAALNRVLLVGSVSATGTISTFSNRPGEACLRPSGTSTCPEALKWKNHFLVAPGQSIYATLPNSSYGYMTGTSMATPIVAGVAALLQQRWPTLASKPETLAKILLTTATDLGAAGVDGTYGYGLLNAANAFKANGTLTITSTTGTKTTLGGTTTGTTTPTGTSIGSKFATALGDVTVYDSYGRDYSLGETGRLQQGAVQPLTRAYLGRSLLGVSSMADWTGAFFADEPQARGFALRGSPADLPGGALGLDDSMRMGVDLPFKGGTAQLRLTGASDPRLDFAHDSAMRPLAWFASSGMLQGTLLSNVQLKAGRKARAMVYAITSSGVLAARGSNDPGEMRLTAQGYLPRAVALVGQKQVRRQNGFGAGYWLQPDARTVVGVNVSAMIQKGGFYDFSSDLDDFQRPTRLANLGVAAARRFGSWEAGIAGELTHLRMARAGQAIGVTPASLVSGQASLRKHGLAFGGAGPNPGTTDSLALAFVVPPRAVSGALTVDYLTRTPDGLGQMAASKRVALSALGEEPARVEAAYRLKSDQGWSVDLTGGINLKRSAYTGAGEGMATFRLPF